MMETRGRVRTMAIGSRVKNFLDEYDSVVEVHVVLLVLCELLFNQTFDSLTPPFRLTQSPKQSF